MEQPRKKNNEPSAADRKSDRPNLLVEHFFNSVHAAYRGRSQSYVPTCPEYWRRTHAWTLKLLFEETDLSLLRQRDCCCFVLAAIDHFLLVSIAVGKLCVVTSEVVNASRCFWQTKLLSRGCAPLGLVDWYAGASRFAHETRNRLVEHLVPSSGLVLQIVDIRL